MRSLAFSVLLLLTLITPDFRLAAQTPSDPVAQALAQGDLFQSKHKYDLALDAYHKADKLSHHSSAMSYLKIAATERKLGDLSAALDDAKKAVKAAGDNKAFAVEALRVRASLLAQMAGKPTDKKLKEAEGELREALALNPADPINHLDLGMVLLRQERDAEGLPELNAYVSSPGADRATVAETRLIIANPIRARTPFPPNFSFTTHESQVVSNASLRGKVVLLDFWGTWCPPCRESVPILKDLNKKYAGKPFQLVGISSDNDEDVWKTFIQAQQMNWSEYMDLSENVLHAFKIDSFPTYIVLDKDGVIRFRQSGLGSETAMELSDAISKALKREPDPKLATVLANDAPAAVPSSSSSLSTSSAAPASDATTKGVAKAEVAPVSVFSGVEAGTISGNLYKNPTLGLTFQFPQGWIAASAETLHALNEGVETRAKAVFFQRHPEIKDSPAITFPKTIFYAARKGNWDGQQLNIPSIRITAMLTKLDSLTPDPFQQMLNKFTATNGSKLVAPASEMEINKHHFVRADLERTIGSLHVYQSFAETVAGEYRLDIEIYGYSLDELQQVAASLQSISIADDKP